MSYTPLDPQRFSAILAGFARARVLVVGDLLADEYLMGEVGRISREAPVLILHHRGESQVSPGGAANAAANIAALGGHVGMAGVVGPDLMAGRLRAELQTRLVSTDHVLTAPDRPTNTKTRISARSQQSVSQQIVRVDRESRDDLPDDIAELLLERIVSALDTVDALLLSDYGNGVFTPKLIAGVLEAAAHRGTIVTVDSQGDLRRFPGAWVLTPNQPEAEGVVGFAITDDDSLRRAGRILLAEARAQNVLITRGSAGMALFLGSGELVEIPAFNRSEVFDVTGAGDTVVGTFTLALAAGATPVEATVIANLAASIVVRRFGTSVTSQDELQTAFNGLPLASDFEPTRA